METKKSLSPMLIRVKRKSKRYSQKKMADKLHISQQALSCYELGKRNVPADVLERLTQL